MLAKRERGQGLQKALRAVRVHEQCTDFVQYSFSPKKNGGGSRGGDTQPLSRGTGRPWLYTWSSVPC